MCSVESSPSHETPSLRLSDSVVSREGWWCPERRHRWSQLLHQSRAFERNVAGTTLGHRLEFWPFIYPHRMNSFYLTSSVGSPGFWALVQQRPQTPTATRVNLRPALTLLHHSQAHRKFPLPPRAFAYPHRQQHQYHPILYTFLNADPGSGCRSRGLLVVECSWIALPSAETYLSSIYIPNLPPVHTHIMD